MVGEKHLHLYTNHMNPTLVPGQLLQNYIPGT